MLLIMYIICMLATICNIIVLVTEPDSYATQEEIGITNTIRLATSGSSIVIAIAFTLICIFIL